eukprot:TRINITY_DN88087_c0_g1_i1.p1 TRINITY_DN88087_c0_g1~~TRINITY_DN88087_c0_g1_i1.p1  ORF type:complete len:223 (-),score=36.37 TRINITY_DN88087_c0_g1_i1:196-864(-)
MTSIRLCFLFSLLAQAHGADLKIPSSSFVEAVEPLPPTPSELAALAKSASKLESKDEPRSPESEALGAAAKWAAEQRKMQPGETIEDVEAKYLSSALTQLAWFLSESPLSMTTKASSHLLGLHKHESERAKHQSAVIALLGVMGLHVNSDADPSRQAGFQIRSQGKSHTMFGGLPWLLILPVVFGIGLAVAIQITGTYYDWQEYKEKIAKGEPIEPDDKYDY